MTASITARAVKWRLVAEKMLLMEALLEESQAADALGGGWQETDSPSERAMRDPECGQREALQRRLGGVEEAIARLDGGTYGTCPDCGSSIGRKRLISDPAVSHCLSCQETFDGQAAPRQL